MTSEPGLLVEDALKLPPLHHGRVVAGFEGTRTRCVRWVAMIEGPVEDFVAPGELVLTIGIGHGYDPEGFTKFAGEIAQAGAAALCVCVGKGAPWECLPPGVLELGDRLGFPIVELPWEIRFADVLRAIADRLLTDRYPALPAGDQLPAGLTSALLRRDGLAAVTEAAETMIGRPVVIMDCEFEPLCLGPLAESRLSGIDMAARVADTPPTILRELRGRLAEEVVALPAIEELGLPAVLATTARAYDRRLGYVLAIGDGRQANAFDVERRALQHAAAAVAIELLRRQSVAEAEARIHGDFLWELGSGELSPQEVTAKATLLGYSLNDRYQLLLGQNELPEHVSLLDDVASQARRRGAVGGLYVTRRGEEIMILVPDDSPATLKPVNLIKRLADNLPNGSVSWGISDEPVTMRTLAHGLSRARRATEVARAINGPGAIGDAQELEPFFILAMLARDPETSRLATLALDPLIQYDARSSGQLVLTLETYLQEVGNTSSTARRLFLNRHSLIYRLRKIEELTGRDVMRAEDRLILDLSLRLRRLSGDRVIRTK